MTAEYVPTSQRRQEVSVPHQHHLAGVACWCVKSDFEKKVERRVAAHVRQQMVKRGLGTNGMARRLDVQKSYISRLLNDYRGADAAFVARMHLKLGMSADIILDEDPPAQFWADGPPPETMGGQVSLRRAPSPAAHVAGRSK